MSLAPLALVIALLPTAQQPQPPSAPASADEQALTAAHIGVSGQALLDFFRQRTPPGPDLARLERALERLADREPAVQKAAAGELVACGPASIPFLRRAVNDVDQPQVQALARQCLQHLDVNAGGDLTGCAARVLAVRKPDGATEALLAFVPFAENEHVVAEVEAALAVVGVRDGKADPALLQALTDKVPARRSAAAAALSQGRAHDAFAAVRKLLADPKPTVRLRVALALAERHDAPAVPVLIDLLAELPAAQRRQAEDFLTQLAGEWAVAVPQGEDELSGRLRRAAWIGWWQAADGPHLLGLLKARTLDDAAREKALDLIARLDAEAAEAREQAAAGLLALGPRAAPLLRQAAAGGNQRVAALAARCLQPLAGDPAATPLPAAALRLLALRRPAGAAEAIVNYLPFAESSEMAQEARALLVDLAVADARPEPALVQALDDKLPLRRAAAAAALAQAVPMDELGPVRKLLATEQDAEVRLRTLLALAARGDRDAVPALIDLLPALSAGQVRDAEEFLNRIAGENAPAVPLGGDEAARRKARDAWAAWWKENGARVDLVRSNAPEGHLLGYTLVVESLDPARGSGRVFELDAGGKVRWQIEGLQFPQCAVLLPGDRVLIAEQNQNRVSERDHKGKVLWERQVIQPFFCQRLANGNTFIAGRQMLVEFDRNGKEVLRLQRLNETILAARRLRDGQIALVTYQGNYVRLDREGKEVKSFRVPVNPNFGFSGAEILPGDRIIVAVQNTGKVSELDVAEGKVVWEANVPIPGVPVRLANGHTLVPTTNQAGLVELDRAGKVVDEKKGLPYRPWRVERR
jgi:HEAT repeat protein